MATGRDTAWQPPHRCRTFPAQTRHYHREGPRGRRQLERQAHALLRNYDGTGKGGWRMLKKRSFPLFRGKQRPQRPPRCGKVGFYVVGQRVRGGTLGDIASVPLASPASPRSVPVFGDWLASPLVSASPASVPCQVIERMGGFSDGDARGRRGRYFSQQQGGNRKKHTRPKTE